MLRQEQNDLLTQTGPGTPGGRLFRSYWLPALLAEELPEDGSPPVRGKLLSGRPALPLPRLEIRRDRPMPRGALGAGGKRLLQQDQAQVLSVDKNRPGAVDLHGPAGEDAAASRVRVRAGAAAAFVHLQAHAGMQLAASH